MGDPAADEYFGTEFTGNVRVARGRDQNQGPGNFQVDGSATIDGSFQVAGEVALGDAEFPTTVKGDLIVDGQLILPEDASILNMPNTGPCRGEVVVPADGTSVPLLAGNITSGAVQVLVEPKDGQGPCAAFFACSTSDDRAGITHRVITAPWGEAFVSLQADWPPGQVIHIFYDQLPLEPGEPFCYAISTARACSDSPDPATEDPPAEDPPAEDPPAEDPPAEDPPAEDPPAEDPPAEDPPAEDPPAEDPPAEDPPAEDPPAEDPPAEDPPAEDPPAEDPPAEDPPAEDPPAEDPPAEDPMATA